MIDKDNLVKWCWYNLQFNNVPETWQDTYIEDILNGYNGSCHDSDGYVHTYSQIRDMFTIYEGDDLNDNI